MATYTITGGTGLVGQQLIEKLTQQNHLIKVLTRNKNKEINLPHVSFYNWDIKKGEIEIDALKTDYIIHMAGAGIADKPWTEARKKEIFESRTKSTQLIFKILEQTNLKPKAVVSASAIGYYGTVTTSNIFDEKSNQGKGFLSEVVKQWEFETAKFRELGIKTTQLRIGIVLAKNGGALQEIMQKPFLAVLGSGKQWMPWIHIEDLVNMILFTAQHQNTNDVFNAVAPHFVSNKDFTKLLAKHSGKWLMPVNAPAFVLKLMLGNLANLVLEGSRVSAQKILDEGYKFKYVNLPNAFGSMF